MVFSGKTCIILSGNDLTADEFKLLVESDADWQALMTNSDMSKATIKLANHTFSATCCQHLLIEKNTGSIII